MHILGGIIAGIVLVFALLPALFQSYPGFFIGLGGLVAFVIASAIIVPYMLRKEKEEKWAEKKRMREWEAKQKQEDEERARAAQQKSDLDLTQVYSHRAGQVFADLAPKGTGQFMVPLSQLPIANTIVSKMCDLMWDKELTDLNLGADWRDKQRYGAETVGTKDKPVWPKDYKGKDAHKFYIPQHTQHLFDQQVPFSFPDTDRFTHHWCLGDNGTGKTTYLRHFLVDDLQRVEKAECSLIVMDSKTLIEEMRMLKHFAPGQPLHDRLTLIDAEEPFPLNPFCLPPEQARSVITYMLANLSDASDLQTGALSFLVDAAMQSPNPTLRTIRDFFKLKRKELPENIDSFDADTQDWFEHAFDHLHDRTRHGLHERLSNFLKRNPLLDRMISADSFGLDMRLLGQGGRVLLVDTNLAVFGEEGANVFGRLIIALINQLSTQRMRKVGKPVFVYIDEAQDYVKNDAHFTNILEKARASKVAMTVAHQHTGQLDTRIEQSLENAGIKSLCEDVGSVSVKTRRASLVLPIKKLEFDHRDWKMTDNQYKQLRDHLRSKHVYKTVSTDHVPEPTDYK